MSGDTVTSDGGREHPCLVDGPASALATVILAHGAGAGMDSDFLHAFACGLAAHGLRIVRFDFPYMVESRRIGKNRPPDRVAVLRQAWLDVLAANRTRTLFIGGKSMGGRIASLIADDQQVAGLICLGYPFHPPGRPERARVEHLLALSTPTLIVQGERDPFGSAAEVRDYPLSSRIRVHWLPDGDHSFRPRAASGLTQEANWRQAIDAVAGFVATVQQQ